VRGRTHICVEGTVKRQELHETLKRISAPAVSPFITQREK
jgi:hypothetical protein